MTSTLSDVNVEFLEAETAIDAARETLLKEVELKIDLGIEGVSFDPVDLRKFGIGTDYLEQQHVGMNKILDSDCLLPHGFYLPHGLFFPFRWDPRSQYRLKEENGKPVLFKSQERVGAVNFFERTPLVDYKLSTGNTFNQIATLFTEGSFSVCYSVECSLQEKGEDCLFCNINTTAGLKHREIFIKTPQQVGEAYVLARSAGFAGHLNLTGGFVPERREVEYYLDVADEIKERTGLDNIVGTAVIGAPLDLKVIDKYKEAGYSSVAIDIEIWDKNIFKAICPGKDKRNGGWEHWVDAIVYAAEVFGKGNVRSNIVGGIEPKNSTLEGIEFFASKGAVCFASVWQPTVGSALEGHRTPETGWHFDLAKKIATIYRQYGFTTRDLFNTINRSGPIHDIFRIFAGENEGDRLPRWRFPQ
ncbi:MAG: radical SAM protein [Chlorobiaceae bacterium]|nr:radical SAM protein [Chlorobiaceae bacterium]